MSIKQISLLSFALINSILIASENGDIICRLANKNDAQKIVELIGTYIPQDKNTVIIYPEKFRLPMVTKSIEKERMFIAIKENQVVGLKEIFLITEKEKLKNALDELGFLDNKERINSKLLKQEDQYKEPLATSYTYIPDINNATINLNLDYTHPDHRQKKINTLLAVCSFQHIQEQVKEYVQQHNSNEITLVYGLALLNDNWTTYSRTPSIAKSFAQFIADINLSPDKPNLKLERVKTIMPLFDEQAATLKFAPQDQWPASSGNALTYLIAKK